MLRVGCGGDDVEAGRPYQEPCGSKTAVSCGSHPRSKTRFCGSEAGADGDRRDAADVQSAPEIERSAGASVEDHREDVLTTSSQCYAVVPKMLLGYSASRRRC